MGAVSPNLGAATKHAPETGCPETRNPGRLNPPGLMAGKLLLPSGSAGRVGCLPNRGARYCALSLPVIGAFPCQPAMRVVMTRHCRIRLASAASKPRRSPGDGDFQSQNRRPFKRGASGFLPRERYGGGDGRLPSQRVPAARADARDRARELPERSGNSGSLFVSVVLNGV